MEIEIMIKCQECDGFGHIVGRHPNDPSSRAFQYFDCQECDGEGQKAFVEIYDSIEDAKADYPDAIYFTTPEKG